MTFAAYETSRASGAPVELFEFVLDAQTWRYTSADADQLYDGHTWAAIPLDRSEIEQTGELNQAALKLTVAYHHPVADLYRVWPPETVCMVRVLRLHRDDGNAITLWLGRIMDVEWSGIQAVMTGEPIYTSLRQPGLRRRFSKLCPHVLYGDACGVNPDDYVQDQPVYSLAGATVVLDLSFVGFPWYQYKNGLLHWTDGGGNVHRRMILKSIADPTTRAALVLDAPISSLTVGQVVRFWPSCDHTLATCKDRFGNKWNFGGFPYIPGKNPFDTMIG